MRAPIPMLLVVVIASLGGCFSRYTSTDEVPPHQVQFLRGVESYYLNKAREQLSFLVPCPIENVSAQIVTTQTDRLLVGSRDELFLTVAYGSQITSLGAEGCGQRQLFQVLCGPYQHYGHVAAQPYGRGCDVVSSSDASRVIQQNQLLERQRQESDDASRHRRGQ